MVQNAIDDIKGDEPIDNGANLISFNSEDGITVNDDAQTLFSEAGIAGLDKEGNLVDDKGDVLMSKDDFTPDDFNTLTKDDLMKKYFDNGDENTELKVGEVITLVGDSGNEVEYTIDENGNAVNKDGDVIEKDKLKSLLNNNANSDDDNLITQISKYDGYELIDENNNPIEFDNTPEGIAKRTKFIVEQQSAELANQKFNEILTGNPELNEAYNYIRVHGSLQGFDLYTDYTKYEINQDDKESQRQLIVKAEMARGRNRDDAERFVKYVEADNNLLTEANNSLALLKQSQAKQIEDVNRKDAEMKQQQMAFYETVQKTTNKVVNEGSILGYKLPENFKIKNDDGAIKTVPRKAFEDFLFKPIDNNGLTQVALMRQKRAENIENLIFDDLLLFLGMDTNQLILQDKEDTRVKKLTIKRKDTNTNRRINIHKNNTSPIDDIK